ncbi:MAG TPA: heme-binding protein [Usitatibacter sp.]|nr:heme-binding protein [Usitatibacter sp.]
MTTAAGGLPIRIGAHLIGAVGVSGTPAASGGGEHDAKCAQQGIVKALGE